MKSTGHHGFANWKSRVVFGAACAGVMAVAGAFLFTFDDEVERRLYWLFVTMAFVVGAFTYSAEKWRRQ